MIPRSTRVGDTTRPDTNPYGWRTPADVVAALKALEAEPLPVIRPASHDAPTIWRAFKHAYAPHPVYAAAVEWHSAARGPSTSPAFPDDLCQAITYVPVHGMHRWDAEQRAAAPAPAADDAALF
ncbi:hypothetical protein AB1K54_06205 [Microbacterium sp. BWT-B31]|uniref:hypothetical protein n=1 Tax=Microbacterium sp. BWT-B31 TaxID=3232072 RepID=UPI0035287B43